MEHPLPYVYRLTHRKTGRFYIGHRSRNVKLGKKSEDDLGVVYFSSSRHVRLMGWENFTAIVLAEFWTQKDAAQFEQDLIAKSWGDRLLINKAKVVGGPVVVTTNRKGSVKAKAPVAYRLGEAGIDLLVKLSEMLGLKRSAVIELAIRELAKRHKIIKRSAVIELAIRELAKRNKII